MNGKRPTEPDRVEPPPGRRGHGHRRLPLFLHALLFMLSFALVFLLLIAIGSAVFGLVETVMAVEAFMARAGPWLRAMQIVAITLLWWHWARVVRWLARRKGLPPRAVEAALSARNRVALGLLFAHLVLVQRLPFVWIAGA